MWEKPVLAVAAALFVPYAVACYVVGSPLFMWADVLIVLAAAMCAWLFRRERGPRRLALLLAFVLFADAVVALPQAMFEIADYLQANATNGTGPAEFVMTVPMTIFNMAAMIVFESRLDEFVGIALANGNLTFWGGCYLFATLLLYVATPVLIGANAYSFFTRDFNERIVRRHIRRAQRRGVRTYLVGGMDGRAIAFVQSVMDAYGEFGAMPVCVFTGVSKDTREKRSTVIERFADAPVHFVEMDDIEFVRFLEKWRQTALPRIGDLHAFYFGDDEASNLSDSLRFAHALTTMLPVLEDGSPDYSARFDATGAPRYHIYCACAGRSDEIALDSIPNSGGIDIHVIDEGREIVYDLLWRHPLHRVLGPTGRPNLDGERSSELVVILVGSGHYGFEALRASAWLGQIPGVRVSIHVIDIKELQEFKDTLAYRCPGFLDTDLVDIYYYQAKADSIQLLGALDAIRDGGVESITGRATSFPLVVEDVADDGTAPGSRVVAVPYCIVSVGNDDLNTDVAIDIRRHYYGDGERLPVLEPHIYVDVYDERRHAVVSNLQAVDNRGVVPFGIEPFGGIGAIFDEAHVVQSDLKALAYNANASYSGVFSRKGDYAGTDLGPEKREELFRGYSRWQMNRLSSHANALGMRAKLWALGYEMADGAERHGLDAASLRSDAEGTDLNRELEELGRAYRSWLADGKPSPNDPIDALARAEHNRWEVFYYGEGWIGESAKASKAFRDLGLSSGRHDSHLLMRHPYLCPFDDLPAVARDLDKDDPTDSDVGFVLNLALIAGDGAGLMGRRFVVRKAGGD